MAEVAGARDPELCKGHYQGFIPEPRDHPAEVSHQFYHERKENRRNAVQSAGDLRQNLLHVQQAPGVLRRVKAVTTAAATNISS